jgi:hypothetical protein
VFATDLLSDLDEPAMNETETAKTESLTTNDIDDDDEISFQNAATRRNITIAYWTVILLCLPYWWFSTTIERHNLPLSAVSAWNDNDVCAFPAQREAYTIQAEHRT